MNVPVPTFKRALPADPVPDLLEPLHSLKRPDLPSRDEDAETKEQECNSSRIRERRSLPPAPQERPRFTSLVFRGVTYSVNDFLYVREAPLSNMVGQLRRVIGQGGDPSHPKWPMVELEWYSVISVTLNRYFRKTDLDQTALGLGAAEWASLADNELFSTSFVSKIHADLLNGKCMVWQLSEYEKQESLDENDFFTRASYDIRKKTISPPFASWERICTCRMPTNPNIPCVCCDLCQRWFHPACLGISFEQARDSAQFFCDNCRRRSTQPLL